jgi:mitochondrial intermediate peptidase
MLGLGLFTRPSDFSVVNDAARGVTEVLLARFLALCDTGAGELTEGRVTAALAAVDGMSNALCQALDPQNAISRLHPDAGTADGAAAALGAFMPYLHHLNTHPPLYAALRALAAAPAFQESATSEQRRFVASLLSECEREGIHLSGDHKAALLARRQAEMVASEALAVAPPHHNEAELRQVATGGAGDRAERGEWEARMGARSSAAGDKVARVLTLRDARHDLAAFIGFPSYADMAMRDRMIPCADTVLGFLMDAARVTAPRAMVELALLTGWQPAGGSGTRITLPTLVSATQWVREHRVKPWQLQRLLAARTASHAAAAGASSGQSTDAFSLSAVLHGMGSVLRSVYGVSMTPVPEAPTLAWPGVVGFRMTDDATGRRLGTVFFDLEDRPGKAPGAAQYVLQCGKQAGPFDDWLRAVVAGQRRGDPPASTLQALAARVTGGSDRAPTALHVADGTGGQEAVVVLSARIVATGALSRRTPDRVHLSLPHVETLWHEMGHVTHTLLSRTQYQHTSGTRTAQDAVELPSHVSEYWCRDARVVTGWAGPLADGASPSLGGAGWGRGGGGKGGCAVSTPRSHTYHRLICPAADRARVEQTRVAPESSGRVWRPS